MNPVAERIDRAWAKRNADRQPRRYIGASVIGSNCEAELSLNLRGFAGDPVEPQLLRIFDDGQRTEQLVISDLRAAGYEVQDVDPETGKQWHYSALGGHLAANLDGLILAPDGTWIALEVKSMNRAYFTKFVERGLAVSHPEYVDQMMLQMGLAQLPGAIMVARCKDNAKYHSQVIGFSQDHYDALVERAKGAFYAGTRRIAKSDFDCTRCFKRTSCWVGNVSTYRNCATCRLAVPDTVSDGKRWLCTRDGASVDPDHVCVHYVEWRPLPGAEAAKPVKAPAKRTTKAKAAATPAPTESPFGTSVRSLISDTPLPF